MFKIYNQLRNVISYKNEFYLNKDGFYNIESNEMTLALNNFKELYLFIQNIYFIWDINGNSILYDTKNKSINNSFKIDSFNYPYFTFYEFSGKSIEGVFNYYENKVLFESAEWLGRDIIDNYIFTDDITCRNINNGEILWHFDIPTIPNNPQDDEYDKTADWEVKKFIGVLENKLWVALNHHTIIALDIETGKLVHQIHDVPTFKSEWLPSAVPHSEATVIDEKSNKLIGFMWEFYWEINPQNGEITLFDLTEDFQSQKVRNDLQDFVLTDSHIYFASHHDVKVAAFNRITKQIDWFHEFKDNGIGYQSRIKKIDGNNEKLGVLTQENILYIFEKE